MIKKKLARCLFGIAQWLSPQQIKSPQEIESQASITGELLNQKTVLITGAAGVIGSAIAHEMAAQGAKLILIDINLKACQVLASTLDVSVIDCVECDIADAKRIDQLVKMLASISSGKTPINIDVLVHAAGIQYERAPNETLVVSQWQKTHNTNVVGPAYLCQQLHSIQGNGSDQNGLKSVLFISSIHQDSVVGWPSYSSSKAALAMLVKEFAVEFAGNGTRVNSIAPGWVALDKQRQPLRSRYSLLKRQSIPPQSIARAAVFLSSEYCSSHTTGATLTIDAAMSLFNHRVDIEYTV